MDAIILAGGKSSPKDPLYDCTKGSFKALVEINGKPMIQWVLDAINDSNIKDVIVIGLPEEIPLVYSRGLTRLADHGSIAANIRAGAVMVFQKRNDLQERVMTVSSDIPGVTPEIVNWCISQFEQGSYDVYYSVVSRDVMEKRYPGSKRSYVHFKETTVCGGDMNAVRVGKIMEDIPIFEALTTERKNALKQAGLIGFDILFLLLIGRLTLPEAEKRISQRLNFAGRVVLSPHAEIAMDVDKPFQLEIMRQDLAGR